MNAENPPRGRGAPALRSRLETPWLLTAWCVVAAFGAYACMYGFRKPFTAATYSDPAFGLGLKTWLVTAQIAGYALSKFLGIKIIAEMPPARRAGVLLALIFAGETALLGFALTPAPWCAAWLFVNGLSLGLVFGLVLGFLEGRRLTELFVAGLCASFILADGFTKSVGAWLLAAGVGERWMPVTAGALFLLPLVGFVWMLGRIPPPSTHDVAARASRTPMTGADRLSMVRRHGIRLLGIMLAYLLITVLRSVRADFAPEIWSGLGVGQQPALFTRSELWVTLGVVLANGAVVLIADNRRAFFASMAISAGGLVLALASFFAVRADAISGFTFMVLLGVGMYVPYVAVHTTVFERLIALTRERGNIGFLMYIADATGYLGYAAVMVARSTFPRDGNFLAFFLDLGTALTGGALAAVLVSWILYARRAPAAAG
jgi:hypothetical protein